MPIKKLVPKVPDPYIGKGEQNQFWPARFGHLDYLIDAINNGGAIPAGFSQVYTELITIPGTVYAGGGPLVYNFPANGLSQSLVAQGKFIVPISFTVAVYESVAPLVPLALTQMFFNVSSTNGTNTQITSIWDIQSAFAGAGATYKFVPIINQDQVSKDITFAPIPVTGQVFQLCKKPAGGGFNGTVNNCLKIAFTFQAIDKSWFEKLTN
jgi:hypothetical protein